MQQLEDIEKQIFALLESNSYPDDFPQQLEALVATRHQHVERLLGEKETLTRPRFDEIVQRTQRLKSVLQKHKTAIGENLVRSKKSDQSLALYKTYQK